MDLIATGAPDYASCRTDMAGKAVLQAKDSGPGPRNA